ncbi:MAG TPA: cyclase family protein [Candidatus Binataceae bacterium]|nr:cyclase family protein [Candidatus Binataceae bacterium]
MASRGWPAHPAIDPAKIVDLTYRLDSAAIGWPGDTPFSHRFDHYGITPQGYFYASGSFATAEHAGTHMDAPIHFSAGGLTADQVPITIGPLAVIDFSARAAADPAATLSAEDVEHWESAHGAIPPAAIVLARSGWGRFWPEPQRYLGCASGDGSRLRFPGFSLAAVDLLLERRTVAAIAIDTASIDPGDSVDFAVHRRWLGAGRPAFENIANAGKLPATSAIIFCIPMKLGGASGTPARIFAVLP